MASYDLPSRTATNSTDNDAVPDEDTSEVTRLFLERLQAWKHACGYLEDYITATEKVQHAHAKEYEKVLKTVSSPLKEAHHFDQSLGGVAGMFDNIRANTQAISNSHAETAKTLKGSVLPVLERLHAEIKNKNKELNKGAGKGSKLVDKARKETQKHVELLGQHTATHESAAGKVTAHDDPYILQRGVYHRLNAQIQEENNNRQDMIAVQNSFAQFEAHVLGTMQTAMGQFNQVVGGQCEQVRAVYADMTSTTQNIPHDMEWNGFIRRNNSLLIDPSAPARSIQNVSFPNQNHRSTQPLIAGPLEKKGKLLKKYETSYWVVTPSKFMHEFKTDDDFAKDPVPSVSIYLPDAILGAVVDSKFNVKGKDCSGSSIGNKFSMTHEYAFKASTPQDAQKWGEVIRSAAGHTTNDIPNSNPSSPSDSRQVSSAYPPEKEGYAESATGAPVAANTGYGNEKGLTSAEREAAQAAQGTSAADRAY